MSVDVLCHFWLKIIVLTPAAGKYYHNIRNNENTIIHHTCYSRKTSSTFFIKGFPHKHEAFSSRWIGDACLDTRADLP